MFGFSTGMTMASVMWVVMFVFFILFFIFVIFSFAQKTKQTIANKKQPILLEEVVVVAKRTRMLRHKMGSSMTYRNVTRYYITFQFQDGNREEFLVPGTDYGMIIENDRGSLKYQGTDFISFIRE